MRRLLVVAALLPCSGCTPRPEQEGYYPVPDFSLTERSGRTVTRDDLRGKVWVASFVFTRCTSHCPQVTRTVARLQEELGLDRRDKLRLGTCTVDPERDQPDDLRLYAEAHGAQT